MTGTPSSSEHAGRSHGGGSRSGSGRSGNGRSAGSRSHGGGGRSHGSRRRRRRRARRIWLWSIVGVLAVLLAGIAWIGVRAFLAKGELEAALPLAKKVQSDIVAADGAAAEADGARLTVHATSAAQLTSDPVWRAAETLPWIGKNLTVMRELAGTVDDVAQGAVLPLSQLAGSIQLSDFKPVGGQVDLQPMIDSRPSVALAANALGHAEERASGIDSSGVIGPLADAHDQLSDLLGDASTAVTALDGAVKLVPAMLGAEGPRNYLVLFQNNAELRSTGGISGAIALIHTDNGALQLAAQASSGDFQRFEPPPFDLPIETKALYGDDTTRYIQDVNLTPQFPLAAQIASGMWQNAFGGTIDGVIAIDPVALSYILEASGPIMLPTGDTLSSENAVQLLLRDVYSRYSKSSEQDDFFEAAAVAVFSAVASGEVDPLKLISAFAKAGNERRILIWNSDSATQNILTGTTLSGGLPQSTPDEERFGVYLNDATGAKMDPYLDVSIATGQVICRRDGLPNYGIRVTLANTAPPDAATSLPPYVTGGGVYGVTPGSIRTNIAVYGPPGSYNLGVARDGEDAPYQPTSDSGYTLSYLQVELAPGESATYEFGFLGDEPVKKRIVIENTPLVYSLETSRLDLSCENALW
ncbi:DUF4012 domain-containing protein [Compostimonas suwonensis]|uniref:DUF4012 domain-containing protein n=1 Tax=Compostimonas suwonensis TaxID=1048394 RepID=UPI0012FE4003|nr:DUF4012 domain-containing protein [Compostimonas suwonensis]